jgi:hypothetical protein
MLSSVGCSPPQREVSKIAESSDISVLTPVPTEILLRHAPDAQFVFVTFAGAFLVKVRHHVFCANFPQIYDMVFKLLQPQYSQYFSYERRKGIHTLVQEAVDLLGAPEVVVDDKHGPKLFSRFLAGLLASQSANTEMLSVESIKSINGRRPSAKSKGKSTYPSGLGPASNYSESPSPAQGIIHLSPDSSSIHSSDFFQPPMPIDQELLDSMPFMADPLWKDTTVPG